MHNRFISGLDLGQSADFTALIVLEQTPGLDERNRPVPMYAARHIERYPLGTPYPAIVVAVRELFAVKPLTGTHLILDRTGVGAPVYDQFRTSGIKAALAGWSITAGQNVGNFTVPKIDLVGAVQSVLGQRRLLIAPELPLAEVLAKELETFRSKVTADRNETFSAWREADHDDLVLALALAVWTGERLGVPGPGSPPSLWKPKG